MNSKMRKCCGATLLEAAMVFPFIIFMLFSAIEFGLSHYFTSILQNATAQAAQNTTHLLSPQNVFPLDCCAFKNTAEQDAATYLAGNLRGKTTFTAVINDINNPSALPFLEVSASAPQHELFCAFFRCNSTLKASTKVMVENSQLTCINVPSCP